MATKQITSFSITKKPQKMALTVETKGFTIFSQGNAWIAEEVVDYSDDTVNVTIVAKCQKDEEYEMEMILNDVSKTISGKFGNDGINVVKKAYPLTDFNL